MVQAGYDQATDVVYTCMLEFSPQGAGSKTAFNSGLRNRRNLNGENAQADSTVNNLFMHLCQLTYVIVLRHCILALSIVSL